MNIDELSESSHPRFEQFLLQFSRWNLDELNDRLDLQNVPVPNAPFLCRILLQKSTDFCFETNLLFGRQTIQEGLKRNLFREIHNHLSTFALLREKEPASRCIAVVHCRLRSLPDAVSSRSSSSLQRSSILLFLLLYNSNLQYP